jgi:uncharacterized membrane protein
LKNLTNADIVSLILEEDTNITEDEELIHMLLDKTISKNINNSNRNSLSFGDKISDKIAEIAGSWYFIISFSAVIFFWIILNVVILLKPFDIYPFILLNLVL